MMSEEMKPCPFCGSYDVVVDETYTSGYVRCRSCGVEGSMRDSYSEAVAAWNSRTVDVDELLEIADELCVCWVTPPDKRTAIERQSDYAERIRKAVGL